MRHLLSREGRAALRRFSRPGTLVALDYDGTLAAIRARPEAAKLAVSTRMLLSRLTGRYPVAVITGRSRGDAIRLLAGVPDVEIIGNHGAEVEGGHPGITHAQVGTWLRHLRMRLPASGGLILEDKGYSLSLHYRGCAGRDKAAVRDAILREAVRFEDARIVSGKQVVNLVPRGAMDKGSALLDACRRKLCPRAIYVGDDVTDEDVFALDRPEKLLGVRMGRTRDSAARYYIRDRDELHRVFRMLLAGNADR